MMISAIRPLRSKPSPHTNLMNRQNRRYNTGFTLLELLIVILIIGFMSNFIIINLPQSSPDKTAKIETKRLAHLISLAAEDSLMRSRPVALHLTGSSYRFLIRTENNLWIPSKDKLFALRKLPKDIQLELNLTNDEHNFEVPRHESPQILLSISGEITPFKIRLVAKNVTAESTDYSELSGQFSGHLKISTRRTQEK